MKQQCAWKYSDVLVRSCLVALALAAAIRMSFLTVPVGFAVDFGRYRKLVEFHHRW